MRKQTARAKRVYSRLPTTFPESLRNQGARVSLYVYAAQLCQLLLIHFTKSRFAEEQRLPFWSYANCVLRISATLQGFISFQRIGTS